MELGKVLIPESLLLHFLCLADKDEMRRGAMEMGKVLTLESSPLQVFPAVGSM
jgi:hypothetical protein